MQAKEKAIEGSVVKPDGTAAKFVAECKTDLANGYVFEAARRCESAQTTDRVAYYANLAFVRSVEDNRAEIQAIMRDMEYHHTGWTWVHTDEAVSLFKQNDTKSLVFDGICQAPLFELMFLLSEPDLLKTWMPDILDGYLVDERECFASFKSWVLIRGPMLFQSRDACLKCSVSVIPSASGDGFLLHFTDAVSPQVPPNCREDTTRISLQRLAVRILPLQKGSVRVTVLSHLDAKTSDWCPRFFRTWAGARAGFSAINTWVQAAKDLHAAVQAAGGYNSLWSSGNLDLGREEGVFCFPVHHKLHVQHCIWDKHARVLVESRQRYERHVRRN